MKFYMSIISIYLLFSFAEIGENSNEKLILGKWKVSEMFCSERDEVPKGFSLTFLKNNKGYLEQKNVIEKEPFTWETNSDTLKLNFERESEVKNVLFKMDKFIFRELPYRKKHIELRYLDFKQCGVELETIEQKLPPTRATINLGIWLNLKLVLYLEDLANPKIGLNLVPNCLQRGNVGGNYEKTMIEKISRDICIIKYRKLPLCEYEKVTDDDIFYYPEIHSFYWLKLQKEFEKKLPNQIFSLTKSLNIDKLIFLGAMNKPWISKFTESRRDFKPLIKAVEYFKSHKIEKKFNGGVKVENKELENFIKNFQIITECDGGFFDFNFIDENENYLFYIHYSGELKVLVLNENANTNFLKSVNQTKFIDSERESTNRIK